uniref:Uncharacterized protein n=1 Tax=Plectus sambesii TaxID=2011161 RepID=A0A914VBW5_9BILA
MSTTTHHRSFQAKLVEKQNQLEALVSRREEVNAHLQNEKKKVAQLRLDLQTKEDMLDRAARQHHAKLADINRQRDQYR